MFRHMEFDPNRPFNSLPDLPPRADIETRLILKACVQARAELAALRQATALLPNPAVLVNTIPLLEAQASSEIENIVTTSDALFRHAQLEALAPDAATKEAMRFRTALSAGVLALARAPLSTRIAEQVCSTIKGSEMRVRTGPGTALASDSTGAIIYTPPQGERLLRDKLRNWEHFVHEQIEIDPLVRMAVSHYQFEAIHPFTDGNGRTGRVLNLLMLVEQRLLDQPVLYLSRYIIRHKAAYYERLMAVTRDAAWETWVLYVLEAVADTAQWTLSKVLASRELIEATAAHARAAAPKQYSRELVELLFVQPYCRIENVVDAGIAKRQTASTYLYAMAEAGILEVRQVGVNKLFLNTRFLALLTRDANRFTPFAGARATARRRSRSAD